LQLVSDSRTLDDWKDANDVPFYQYYYIFDTQNPNQYIMGDVPVVKAVGPFAYRLVCHYVWH